MKVAKLNQEAHPIKLNVSLANLDVLALINPILTSQSRDI